MSDSRSVDGWKKRGFQATDKLLDAIRNIARAAQKHQDDAEWYRKRLRLLQRITGVTDDMLNELERQDTEQQP